MCRRSTYFTMQQLLVLSFINLNEITSLIQQDKQMKMLKMCFFYPTFNLKINEKTRLFLMRNSFVSKLFSQFCHENRLFFFRDGGAILKIRFFTSTLLQQFVYL